MGLELLVLVEKSRGNIWDSFGCWILNALKHETTDLLRRTKVQD